MDVTGCSQCCTQFKMPSWANTCFSVFCRPVLQLPCQCVLRLLSEQCWSAIKGYTWKGHHNSAIVHRKGQHNSTIVIAATARACDQIFRDLTSALLCRLIAYAHSCTFARAQSRRLRQAMIHACFDSRSDAVGKRLLAIAAIKVVICCYKSLKVVTDTV